MHFKFVLTFLAVIFGIAWCKPQYQSFSRIFSSSRNCINGVCEEESCINGVCGNNQRSGPIQPQGQFQSQFQGQFQGPSQGSLQGPSQGSLQGPSQGSIRTYSSSRNCINGVCEEQTCVDGVCDNDGKSGPIPIQGPRQGSNTAQQGSRIFTGNPTRIIRNEKFLK